MAWRVELSDSVEKSINGLYQSGALTRAGLLHAYNAVRINLPLLARRFQDVRDPSDPDYFLYAVRNYDKGAWHHYIFYVNDAQEPGVLIVEDMEHEGGP